MSGTVTANAGSGTFGVTGTITANQGTSPWVSNISQFGGVNISTGTGASGTGIPRVTVSNDSNILATQSGTWTVQQGGAPWSVTIPQSNNTLDYDTGAGTQTMTIWGLALPANGGAVAGGTATNPIRIDPTGTTTQPVTATQGTTPWLDHVTTWAGSTLGAITNYGTSPGAVLVPGVNAFITNTPSVAQSGTWTVTSNQGTTPWVDSVTTWGGGTLGAMANYGTSPGAVLVPGVNAFITNVPAVSQNGTWTVQQGSPPWQENLTQVAGSAVATAASGSLKVGITGNTGVALDAAGQNAPSPANELLVAGQFNTTPTTITTGNVSPLQLDSAGNLLVNVKAGGASGGTSSTFGAAFPSTGTAIGVKSGANMTNLTADGSSNLNVNCAVGCSASSFADQSAFLFGTTAINTIGGVYSASPTPLASGTAGAALMTAGRILEVNRRDSAGQELGSSLRGQANIPVGVAQVPTALAPSPLLPASALWDGKNYAAFTPPGASAIATQPALVTALSPNTALPAGTNVIGAVTQSGGPWSVSGTVTANQGTSPWVANVSQFGGVNISTGTGASGTGIPRVTVSNDSNVLATQSGTWTVQQGGAPWTVSQATASNLNATVVGTGTFAVQATDNITQFGGVNISTGTGASGTGIPRVTVANDSNILATQSGTWTVQPGNTANTTPWLMSISAGGNTATVNGSNQLLVNCGNCSGSGVSQTDATTFTYGVTAMAPIGGAFSSAPTPLASGQAGAVLLTAGRIIQANPRDSSGQELGSALPGKANIPVGVAQVKNTLSGASLLQPFDPFGQMRTASWITDGTDYAAVTPGGKPARSTDGGLVTAFSPNSPLPAGTNAIGTVTIASNQTAADPCMWQAKTNVAISTASGTTNLVTGVSAKKVYVCSIVLVAATAISVSLSEGSATLCATSSQAGVLGVATNGTAANGIALVANGGITLGNGGGTIASTATAANYLCLFQSGTAQISGNLTYVQQ